MGPLTDLYNDSLQKGIVLSAWKQSHISPVHTDGTVEDRGNYIPIAVAPVAAKILEKR